MMKETFMILNGINIGVRQVTLNQYDLMVVDKTGKYKFTVTVYYHWQKISKAEIGEIKEIEFNEYCLEEDDESALIWPTKSYIQKLEENKIMFYFNFENLDDTDLNNINYMNKKGMFDKEIKNLEVKVYIDYEDAQNGTVKYNS